MKLCLSQVTICETDTVNALEAATRGGFSAVDLWWPRLQVDLEKSTVKEILSVAEKNAVSLSSISGLGLELVGSEDLWRESCDRAEGVFGAAESLRVPLVNFTPGLTHQPVRSEFYSLAARRLTELKSRAEARGLNLALEFRSDSRWLTSLATVAGLIEQIGDDRLGICLDTFHYYCGPSKLEDMNQYTIGSIRSVHLSDLIGTPRETACDSDRILPGEGDFELHSIMACLRRSNYDGLLCVEVPNPQLWPIAADRVTDMAYQALLRVCLPDDRDS